MSLLLRNGTNTNPVFRRLPRALMQLASASSDLSHQLIQCLLTCPFRGLLYMLPALPVMRHARRDMPAVEGPHVRLTSSVSSCLCASIAACERLCDSGVAL